MIQDGEDDYVKSSANEGEVIEIAFYGEPKEISA